MASGWTAERDALILAHARAGKSSSEIAIALRDGTSRNAVIGRLNRIKGAPPLLRRKPVPGSNADRDSQILQMWSDGESAGEIAKALHLTRNQVTGLLYRLGAPKRAAPKATKKHAPHIPRPPQDKLVRLVSSTEPKDIKKTEYDLSPVLIDGKPITIMELNDRLCRFPVSGSGVATQFCGHPPKLGKPYCEAHAIRTVSPAHAPRVHAPRYG